MRNIRGQLGQGMRHVQSQRTLNSLVTTKVLIGDKGTEQGSQVDPERVESGQPECSLYDSKDKVRESIASTVGNSSVEERKAPFGQDREHLAVRPYLRNRFAIQAEEVVE